MKQLLLICLILLALFACKQDGDTRVVELENGNYAIQCVDYMGDWAWLAKDSNTYVGWGNIMYWGNGLREFESQDTACAYAKSIQRKTHIKHVVKCE